MDGVGAERADGRKEQRRKRMAEGKGRRELREGREGGEAPGRDC